MNALQAAAIEAVEKARADEKFVGSVKIKALKFLRDATGLRLPECVPPVDWALAHPRTTLTRAGKERAVDRLTHRLASVSMDFAYAISQGAAPDIKRLRARKRWLHAALVRLAMARTVD